MNRTEHLITVLMEECAEVAQRCSKALRFGLHQKQAGHELTNAGRIDRELQDLHAAVAMLRQEIGGQWFGVPDDAAMEEKRLKVESYMGASLREIERLDREHT